jgi:peptide chain release factor 2
MSAPGFWDDQGAARAVLKRSRVLSAPLDRFRQAEQRVRDFGELVELVSMEGGDDASTLQDLEREAQRLQADLEEQELGLILTGPHDGEDALLTLHAGAGGTDAQDWVEMLLRLYLRWAERRGFATEILDSLPGEEAGLKSVVVAVRGDNAYGYLRPERGVHRLVRMSPFDASGRRHTSFAAVEVAPDLADEGEIEIKPEDVKIDTFRASGAGGQHVNKTESAVRLTHLPTGIVVSCQNERSQHSNRETAWRMLRAKLAARQEEEQRRQKDALRGMQTDIAWGSQIRSYVLQPYTVARDHRTRVEIGNVQAVLDGEIDPFIQAFLMAEATGGLNPEAPA